MRPAESRPGLWPCGSPPVETAGTASKATALRYHSRRG